MQQPETRYVSVGRQRVAYQVFGEGERNCLLLIPPLYSVDAMWESVGHLRVLRMASDQFRCVMLDHRGFGMSDAIPEPQLGDLAVCVEDALAVLNEVGIESVNVLGAGYGGYNAMKLVADHSDRVDRLALVNPAAKAARGDGYELGEPPASILARSEDLYASWGSGRTMSKSSGLRDDLSFLARFERMGGRPSAAAALVRNSVSIDVRPLLGHISVPTLVVHSAPAAGSDSGPVKYVADHIPDAQLFESQSTEFFWGGGAIEEVLSFLGGTRAGHRELATVVFTDVVNSTRSVVDVGDRAWRQTLDFLDDLVAARTARAGGRIVKQTGDGHLIEFDRPGDAVRAALGICRDAPTLGVRVRAGVHTGEIERRDRGDLGGLSVHIAARVAAIAGAGEVVVTRTVADLLGSADPKLHERGEHELRGIPGVWQLLTVTE